MDFIKQLTQFLHKEYIRSFHWEKALGYPLKTFRAAVHDENITSVIAKLDKKSQYDYHGAYELALKIHGNLLRISKEKDALNYLKTLNAKEVKALLYLQQASKIFPAVVLPQQKESLNNETFRQFYFIFRRLLPFFNSAGNILLTGTWENLYPFKVLSGEEIKESHNAAEYSRFVRHFQDDGVYELMKMSQEFLGFTTLNHVLGVHALAMKLGRQLKEKGFDVDLAIISATSINHDIGKFGCKGDELKRIAYLHYYYTKEWFDRYNMPVLSHVAMNHGTWDLENIRLPIETLVLIYSDFCVKNRKYTDGSFNMSFFPIDEAFEVIKNMLDNLDEQKILRYQTVYEKLKDLDDLFSLLGVDRNIGELNNPLDRIGYKLSYDPVEIVNGNSFGDIFALLPPDEISLAYKNLSLSSNFKVLYHLRDVKSLSHIFEQARLEKNWKDLRTYLRIIENYSDYFTHDQRIISIDFLFELLSHDEDDIRYHSSLLIAEIVKNVDSGFNKELPENVHIDETNYRQEVFKRILNLLDYDEDDPDENMERKEQRIYNTTIIIRHLFSTSGENRISEYKKMFFDRIPSGIATNDKPLSILYMAEIMLATFQYFKHHEFIEMLRFIKNYLSFPVEGTRLMVENLLLRVLSNDAYRYWHSRNGDLPLELIDVMSRQIKKETGAGEIEILKNISQHVENQRQKKIPNWQKVLSRIKEVERKHCKNYRNIFLENFKTRISWVTKKSNCDFLAGYVLDEYKKTDSPYLLLETAGHFANLLKVSRVEGTRFRAGQRLLQLLPALEINQVNEIAIELLRSLEQDDEGYTQYIPRVLGDVIIFLPPAEFNEIIEDIAESLKSQRIALRELFIKTLGHVLKHISESRSNIESSREKILGLLINAVFDTDEHVAKAAYNVFGNLLLKVESDLSLEEKRNILSIVGKKLITQIRNRSNSAVSLFYSSFCLNQIYRFISSQEKIKQPLTFPQIQKIAFVPGTYDPFTNGHRELVKIAAEKGYEVFIQVDEYSWSKRTLPRLLRKHIVRMSIADIFNVYLFPAEPPLNLANLDNLKALKEIFEPRPISLVVGTDVITSASAYKNPPRKREFSIFDFHHLIFLRPKSHKDTARFAEYLKRIEKLNPLFRKGFNEIVLEGEITKISSSSIRESVEKGLRIDDMVDPLVARFIQERRLYVHAPEHKSEIGKMVWRFRTIDEASLSEKDILNIADLYQNAFRRHPARSIATKSEIIAYFKSFIRRKNARILILENIARNDELIGFLAYFEIESIRILSLVQSQKISSHIREKSSGPLVYSNIIAIKSSYQARNLAFELKTRAALQWIEQGYMYSLSKVNASVVEKKGTFSSQEERLFELNEEMGYQLLPYDNEEKIGGIPYKIRYMLLNLQRPVLMVNDLIDQFKGPYQQDKKLISLIHHNQKVLSGIFREIFPGNLLLRINNHDLVAKVVEKICEVNKVPFRYGAGSRKKLGENMSILLGQVLGRDLVPHTVTKALHADRTIDRSGHNTFFMPYPYYSDIETQLKIMKNFGRKPILADIFSLSGATLLHLVETARKLGMPIDQVVVGIISGEARELLHANKIDAEHLIHLPRLTNWFNLRHFYPFIGGETINQPFYYREMIIESMNYIFPYRRAMQLADISREHLLNLSRVCLTGSYDIFRYLEDQYLNKNNRELTLMHLPEIMEDPRRPIHNSAYQVDWNETITNLLKGDIEQLERYYF